MKDKFAFNSQINDPPRCSWFGAVLLIFLIIVYGLFLTYVLPKSGEMWVPRAMILMLPLAIASKSIYTIHFNLFLLCLYLMGFFPHFSSYPFNHLTVLVLYAYVVMLIPELRSSVGWLRVGKFDAKIWMFILVTIVVPCAALTAWVHVFSPDLTRYSGMVPKFPLWLALLYGIGNSAFNAALEETTWRGVMMEALDSAFGPGLWSVVIQAVSFAVAHYRSGFPNGIVGSSMVLVYGLMLGTIRRKSRGMLGCWLAHVAADSTIYGLVFYFIHETSR
jgi:membrane protease YdiL (CAAX protease family)